VRVNRVTATWTLIRRSKEHQDGNSAAPQKASILGKSSKFIKNVLKNSI
jgi:hypothetical protein